MNDLTERQRILLTLVVRDYIETAEPVGSKTIVERYKLDMSPATVRNEMAMLTEMGRCLDIIGEAVFSTRGWEIASEGDGIRFTRNKENTVLYVTNLGWFNDELRIRTLSSSRIDLKTLASVSLLGAPGPLTYRQNAEGLTITVPPRAPYDSPAYAFKLTFSGQIPMLNQ